MLASYAEHDLKIDAPLHLREGSSGQKIKKFARFVRTCRNPPTMPPASGCRHVPSKSGNPSCGCHLKFPEVMWLPRQQSRRSDSKLGPAIFDRSAKLIPAKALGKTGAGSTSSATR